MSDLTQTAEPLPTASPRWGLASCLALGVVWGWVIAVLPWQVGVLVMAAVLGAVLAIGYPLAGGYLIVPLMLVLADKDGNGNPGTAWPVCDVDVVRGLPSAFWSFFLLLFAGYFFRALLIDRKASRVPIAGLAVFLGIVLMAAFTGRQAGWNPMTRRIDFLNMLFPALFFYLAVNLFDTTEHMQRALRILLGAAALHAVILSAYFIAGRGVPFALSTGTKVSRIVTLDSGALMTFIAMSVLAAADLMSGRGHVLRRAVLVACCLPMAFAVVFSFRRTEWLGGLGAFGLLMLLARGAERRRLLRAAVPALLAFVLLAAGISATRSGMDFGAMVKARTRTVSEKGNKSNAHHMLEPLQAIRDTSRHPIRGLGLGGEHGPIAELPASNVPLHVVHNTWIYVWMKLGLAGLLFLLWCSWVYVSRLARALRHCRSDALRPMLAAMLSLAPLWFAQSMTSPMLWYPHQTCLVVLFAAFGLNLARQAAPASGKRPVPTGILHEPGP